jgi:divalent metal cation (Fe/Co/Zn/Cd) transporter
LPNRTSDGQTADVERWGWYSIGINVILALINLVVALASGSLAVEAEMIHNIVDFLTAVGVLIGLKLATRKSKAFPYGLYKIENVVSVVLAVMTFFTAYEIARDALFAPARVATVNAWMLVGVVVATAIPLAFSHMVVINKADLNLVRSDEITAFCAAQGVKVIGRIPYDTVVTEAMVIGQPATAVGDNAVARALREVWTSVRETLL